MNPFNITVLFYFSGKVGVGVAGIIATVVLGKKFTGPGISPGDVVAQSLLVSGCERSLVAICKFISRLECIIFHRLATRSICQITCLGLCWELSLQVSREADFEPLKCVIHKIAWTGAIIKALGQPAAVSQ